MTFRSTTQPFCRWCGKPIRKKTSTIWFGSTLAYTNAGRASNSSVGWTHRTEKPTSLAEAQKLVNEKIVSVAWTEATEEWTCLVHGVAGVCEEVRPAQPRYIDKVTAWDGESYIDDLFDTGECARKLGRNVAKNRGFATDAYREAVAKNAVKPGSEGV